MFLGADLAFSVRADRTGRDVLRQDFAGNLIDGSFYRTEENEFLCRGMFCEIIENLLGQVGVYFEIDVSRRLVFRIVSFPGKMDNSIDIRNRTVFKIPPENVFSAPSFSGATMSSPYMVLLAFKASTRFDPTNPCMPVISIVFLSISAEFKFSEFIEALT